MKSLTLLFISGIIFLIVLLTGVSNFFLRQELSQPAIVIAVDPTTTYMEKLLGEQETAYQTELNLLEQSLQQDQTAFDEQLQSLKTQITQVQNQLDELEQQRQDLLTQVPLLEATRTGQLARHQTNLEQLRQENIARQSQLQSQLNETQAELAQVNAQLQP
jgi:chromosome segregation ATPase